MRKIDIIDQKLLAKVYKVKLFQYLDVLERDKLIKSADFFEYFKDENIVTQGEVSYCVYAVVSGNLNVTINSENGKEIQISNINEGDFFGETGIFTNGLKRTANVSPVDSAIIMRIGRDDFFNFIRTYPKAGVNILMIFVHGLINRLNTTNQELAVGREALLDKIPFFEKND